MGLAVAQGSLEVATYVVFLATVKSIGPTVGHIFHSLFDIGKGYASVKKLSYFLNADTRRKLILFAERERSVKARPLLRISAYGGGEGATAPFQMRGRVYVCVGGGL